MENSRTVKQNKKLSNGEYHRAFKVKILEDYVRDDLSIPELARKHGIDGDSIRSIKKLWLAKEGYFRILESMNNKEENKSKEEQLAQENQKLRKALELATLKIAGLETMIEIAEDEFKIAIRKKSGAKQSKR